MVFCVEDFRRKSWYEGQVCVAFNVENNSYSTDSWEKNQKGKNVIVGDGRQIKIFFFLFFFIFNYSSTSDGILIKYLNFNEPRMKLAISISINQVFLRVFNTDYSVSIENKIILRMNEHFKSSNKKKPL